jgi:lysophospholipase L1-like esterase
LRTKLVTTFLGLVSTAMLAIACQPMLEPDDSRPAHGAVSAADRVSETPVETVGGATTRPGLFGLPILDVTTVPPGAPSSTSSTSPTSTTSTTAAPTTTTTPPPTRPDSPGGDIEHYWYGTGTHVAILGDSLTVQARPHLRELAAGSYALKVGALYGEGVSGGALSVNLPDPIMPAVVDEYADDPPDVVVLALGTNDVWQRHLGLASFEREWHAATRRFPEACLVGVTVTETTEAWMYDAAEARDVNRVIRRTVDEVVDWAREGRSDRYTDTDNIHLTAEGRERFAELVMAGVERCGRRTT